MMAKGVSESLPDDALRAIFKSLPRRDLRRIALTNAQFSDIIIPILDAKAKKLVYRIPPTLELYDHLVGAETATIDLLRVEANRLQQEYRQLTKEIYTTECASGNTMLQLYGPDLMGKVKAIVGKMRQAYDSYYGEERRKVVMYALDYQMHQVKAEFHQQMEAAKLGMITTSQHARLADLLLRAMDMCVELNGLMKHIVSKYDACNKYRVARVKLQVELEVLRRVVAPS